MAAAGTSPALNLREKLAELAGLKQRVSPDLVRCDFTNLVTNGDLTSDATGFVDASSAGGAIAWNASGYLDLIYTSGLAKFYTSFTSITGARYKLTVDKLGTTAGINISDDFGGATILVGANNSTDVSSAFNSQSTTTYVNGYRSTAGTSTVDNFTIYEADPSDDAPWLRLPYGYKVGKRGMIVRDGVVLHPSDYTEITDSGQTWIKPITAPGVSTEFSIWAGA